MTRFAWGALTDTGMVRKGNEDAYLAVDGLFAVADGMGGHQAGEVASRLALESLQSWFGSAGTDVLVAAVERANADVVERSLGDPELAGMGTTLVAMALVDAGGRDAIGVVNVGDSRLYLLSDGVLTQITEDHSLVATMVRQGRLTEAEAAVHPQRNILTRALGIDGTVLVDSWEVLPVVGDRYLVCSDGLFNEVDDNRIAATLRRLADPAEACRELVRLANESGGRDNITCVVV
ncbi:MAG: Stp1/IreP family PP2C-type Ser/Thr phosphatase, partial [Acidimicrobiia bacterium]|nr:Stp1/IreP family PP2C-type Ser/Thr phosphatase [Acidimicrobiia bacterium]